MIEFDDFLFCTRLPRCDFYLVEDLPRHGIVSTQSVGLAVPNVPRRIANSIRNEEHRQRECLPVSAPNLIGTPDNGEAIRVFPLCSFEIFESVQT